MGFWSDLTGKTGADAATAAAADTYGKQQSAIARLLGYGDEYKAGYDTIGASYQPYVNSDGLITDGGRRLHSESFTIKTIPNQDLFWKIRVQPRSSARIGLVIGGDYVQQGRYNPHVGCNNKGGCSQQGYRNRRDNPLRGLIRDGEGFGREQPFDLNNTSPLVPAEV